MSENLKVLSASRIKTLQTCSWLYHCNYILNLPQKSNSGALRGTICHLVFEVLLNPRHKEHYDKVISANDIKGSPAVNNLVKKHMKAVGLTEEADYDLVNAMILVGLKHDFFCEGGEIVEPEYKFKLANKSPQYTITGFIDKPAIFKNEKVIKICDYKSSKAKFKGEELESNIQAMLYSLAARSIWPDLKPVVQFIFLRFPKQPIQELTFTDSQLRGFAYWLEQINKVVDKFDEKSARTNFAADSYNRWLCKAGKTWVCPYLKPFDYYALVDKDGKTVKTSFKKDLKAVKGQKVVKKVYEGCPKHVFKKDTEGEDDGFGF